MMHSIDDRIRPAEQATHVHRKNISSIMTVKPTAHPATRFSGDVLLVRQITNLHRTVMLTLEETKPKTELNLRLRAFAAGVLVAAELAEVIPPAPDQNQDRGMKNQQETATLQDLTQLAYAALDIGKQIQGLQVLEGIGFLLGGHPKAALERALGLLRLKQTQKAREELETAVEGSADADGLISALLVQLWFDVQDRRWIQLAKRVMATSLNIDARARCAELLASVNAR